MTFSMRPHLYLRYSLLPARSAPLLLIACFSVGFAAAAQAGLLGLPLGLILLSWLMKYSFVLFDTAALGLEEPPVLSVEMVNPLDEQRPLGQLVIAGVIYGATEFVARKVDATLATGLRGAALLLLPASVAVLGSTRNLVDAINPVLLVKFVRRVGLDYVGLCLALVGYVAFAWYMPWGRLWLVLDFALLQFATLALFGVLGGMVYERRHELGYEPYRSPERDEERRVRERERASDREADEIHNHYRSGFDADAWHMLQKVLDTHAHSLDTYHALYRRMALWADPRLANALARQMLSRLLATRHPGDALAIVRERLRATPDFRPETGADTLRLALLARSGGDSPTARMLLADFGRHFPADAAAIRHAADLAQEIQR